MESQRYARRLPMERLHRAATDVQPRSASTQGNSASERRVQLHIMLHVYCRLHAWKKKNNNKPTALRDTAGFWRSHDNIPKRAKAKPPNPRIPPSLSSPRNRSAHFHKVQRRSRCQRSDAHRKRECHTEAKLSACLKRRIGATGSSALRGEGAQCARIEGAFMCRQTLPTFHCYLPAQARTQARWAGRHQWECGGAGRRHGGHMWSCALQGKAASSLKNDESENTHSAVFQPSVTSGSRSRNSWFTE